MVLKETVFIVGAGGSIDYGFPSGRGLLTRLIEMHTTRTFPLLQECGFDYLHIDAFRTALEASPRFSVDAFLNSRREFLDVGKHAIAAELLPNENDASLRPALDRDWMRYLFNKILPGQASDVTLNRLAILTFNFDRSFERALWLALKAEYGLNDQEAANLVQALAPVHIHGDLGEASWLTGRGRNYGGEVKPDDVRAAAARLKIVFEEIPDETKIHIRRVLQATAQVCFLGFGYDPENLRKLGIPQAVTKTNFVRGTVLDLAAGEVARIKRDLSPLALNDAGDSDMVKFLRRTDLVHD